MVTPWATTTSSALVSSQLPPRSAARSTITEPGAMASTMASVTSTGDCRPGIAAVVITTSLRATTVSICSCWRRMNSALCSLA